MRRLVPAFAVLSLSPGGPPRGRRGRGAVRRPLCAPDEDPGDSRRRDLSGRLARRTRGAGPERKDSAGVAHPRAGSAARRPGRPDHGVARRLADPRRERRLFARREDARVRLPCGRGGPLDGAGFGRPRVAPHEAQGHVPGAALVPRRPVPRGRSSSRTPRRSRGRWAPRPATRASSRSGSTSSASPSWTWRRRSCASCRRPTSTSTSTPGRRTDARSRPSRRRARATTTGGAPSSSRWTRPREPRASCGSRLSRSRAPSSRPTARPWRSSTAS